ncbi:MAG: alanine:cation symporter family protein, partial [Lachnospiraceae bacterium]|nr:alanine:cation symporter family protein [Lachnospiraceae bacterium]
GTLLVLLGNFSMLGEVFHSIISFAFGSRALGGAAIGIAIQNAVTWGLKRGIFSNEAGLGSSVIVHAAANVSDPVRQGMWGIFEVFADTIVVCTLTAFAILSSGLIDLQTGEVLTNAKPTALVSEAFGTVFHIGEIRFGSIFIAIAILFFAFATILGWSYYGAKAWEFLFGTRSTIIYKGIFVLFIMIGATMNLDLVWNISDAFNGLMAIPNLIGVLALSGTVVRITRERDG